MKNTINTTSENRALYSYEYELQAENILDFDPTDILNILNRADIFDYIYDSNEEIFYHELGEYLLHFSTPEKGDLLAIHNYLYNDFAMTEETSVFAQKAVFDFVSKLLKNKTISSGKELFEFVSDISFDTGSCPIGENDIFVVSKYEEKSYFANYYDYFENIIEDIARDVIDAAEENEQTVAEFLETAISEGSRELSYYYI